jgi:hypothetical protein
MELVASASSKCLESLHGPFPEAPWIRSVESWHNNRTSRVALLACSPVCSEQHECPRSDNQAFGACGHKGNSGRNQLTFSSFHLNRCTVQIQISLMIGVDRCDSALVENE